MKNLSKAGKILFAIPFVFFGFLHFADAAVMENLVPSFLPGGKFWIFLTGTALFTCGAAILADQMTRTAALILAGLIMVFVLMVWVPMIFQGVPIIRVLPAMFKDIALAGAALIVAGESSE